MTTRTDGSASGAAEPRPGAQVPHLPSSQADPDPELRGAADDFNWLLSRFAAQTAGVVDAIGVSSDGLLIAVSQLREHAESERLAAIVSGLTSLAAGASGHYGLGGLNKVIVDLEGGHLLVSALGAGVVTSRRRNSATSRTRWLCSPTARAPRSVLSSSWS